MGIIVGGCNFRSNTQITLRSKPYQLFLLGKKRREDDGDKGIWVSIASTCIFKLNRLLLEIFNFIILSVER